MSDARAAAALDAGRLAASLGAEPFVTRLVVLESVGSTNDEMRRLAAEGAPEGTVVVAGGQSAGRGRRGRAWHSAPGLGLYLSVLLRPGGAIGVATRWTVAAALAACRASREYCGDGAVVEWPNDVLFEGRKLGGILAELRSAGGRPLDLVLGIGLNVNQRETDFPLALRGGATSLHLAAGRGMLERESVAGSLLRRLGEVAARLNRGDWERIAHEWESLAPTSRGRRVRVECGTAPGEGDAGYEGFTRGLDADGALLVERSDGRIVPVRLAGTVTVVE